MTKDEHPAWNDDARIRCRFLFMCPKRWAHLQPTPQDGVRYCGVCRRDVHLALTEEALLEHSLQGHCIAVPVVSEKSSEETTIDEMHPGIMGMVLPPYNGDGFLEGE